MIELELPWPKGFNSHNTGHWRTKAKAVASLRATARIIAISAMNSGASKILGSHRIDYTFYVQDNRKRDAANMIQQCKPYIDGIVDSGIIEGDHWQISSIGLVMVIIERKSPRVVLGLVRQSGE